jgi:hypothetical protein
VLSPPPPLIYSPPPPPPRHECEDECQRNVMPRLPILTARNRDEFAAWHAYIERFVQNGARVTRIHACAHMRPPPSRRPTYARRGGQDVPLPYSPPISPRAPRDIGGAPRYLCRPLLRMCTDLTSTPMPLTLARPFTLVASPHCLLTSAPQDHGSPAPSLSPLHALYTYTFPSTRYIHIPRAGCTTRRSAATRP